MFKKFLVFLLILWSSFCYAASQQTSSTTAATIIDRVEARLNDSDNRMWSAGNLLTWLNEGMVDIVTRTFCLESTDTETLVANQIEYPVSSFDNAPWYYVTIRAVHYIDSDSMEYALQKGSPASVGQNTSATIPRYWYEWSGSVGIYPALTSINGTTAETIKVYYVVRPTAIASTANITTPAIYDSALVHYIVAQAYMRDNQLNRYLQTMVLYEQEMARIRRDLNDIPPGVVE